jgi:hypothetical protein
MWGLIIALLSDTITYLFLGIGIAISLPVAYRIFND